MAFLCWRVDFRSITCLNYYIRPVCFQRPEEEENSLSLLVESRREKVRTIKGKENRSRSIAAGLLLRHMLLEEQIPYAEESFGLEGHGKPRLKKDGVFFNLSHAGAYAVGALSDVPVGVDVEQQNRFGRKPQSEAGKADINGSGMELVERCRG